MMSHRIRTGFTLILAGILAACTSTSPPAPPSVPRKPSAETIAATIIAAAPKLQDRTIAVIEFSELRGTTYVPSAKGRFLAERITTELVKTDQVDVIERAQLEKVRGELKLGASGVVDETTAKSIGKILGVEAIVTGTVTDVGRESVVHARLVRVEDGKILAAEEAREVIQLAGRPADPLTASDTQPMFSGSLPGDPTNLEANSAYRQYDRLLRDRRFEALERETEFALDRNRGDFIAHLYQAILFKETRRPLLAREHLMKAYRTALQSSTPEPAIRLLVSALLKANRPGMARAVVSRALADRPQFRQTRSFNNYLQGIGFR